jgi:chemotaxis protein CheZ
MSASAEDLEALFDQVASEARAAVPASKHAPAAVAAVPTGEAANGGMFHRVGHLTRTLHDALRELGYDRSIEQAVEGLPDARDRLDYIAKLTGQAAERALSAVERGQSAVGLVGADGAKLSAQWERLYAGELGVDEFKALGERTRAYLAELPKGAADIGAQFHEIMMAQDFHDLTGQVIGRMAGMVQRLEQELVKLLIEARPPGAGGASEEWLTGPAMNAAARSDVVANQAQVDSLLESLGF